MREAFLSLVATWVRLPGTFRADIRVPSFCQHPSQFQLLLDLLVHDHLDLRHDHDAIARYLDWVDGWPPEKKAPIERACRRARFKLPADDLWARLHVPRTDPHG